MTDPAPERLAPGRPFPPYAFVPGHRPHPGRHPEGHSYGHPEPDADPFVPEQWAANEWYLYGIDLFNFGYYWEAHEAWEAVWHATGHHGPLSEFLKGLIKLTAAGVKVRQGQLRPLRTHAERAREHFISCRDELNVESLGGLDLNALIEIAQRVYDRAEDWKGHPSTDVEIVFDFAHVPA